MDFVLSCSKVKPQQNSLELLDLWLLQISSTDSSNFVVQISCNILSDPQLGGFLLFNCWPTGNLVKGTFCVNFASQKLDLPNTTHSGNISEGADENQKICCFHYVALLCSGIISHSGGHKEILMHHLDSESGQFKLWNMSLKFCILECHHPKLYISTAVNPKPVWSYATIMWGFFLTFFLKNKICLLKLLVAEYFYLK